MLVTDWLRRAADHYPERVALEDIATGERLSYAALDGRVGRIAWTLRERYRLQPGARVAILAQNRFAHLELLFACARAGLVLVPLNWRLAATELRSIVRDFQPSLLVHEPDFAAAAIAAVEETDCIQLTLDDPQGYDAMQAKAGGSIAAMAPRQDSDLWMLLYTSGTTGQPKGVMQTFGMVYVNAVNTLVSGKVVPGDVFLNVLPFFHTGGLNLYTLPVLMTGGSVIIAPRFDPAATLARLSRDVVSMFAVPAIYLTLANHPDFTAARFPRLRNLSVGGAPIPPAIGEAFAAKGLVVAPSYGMTEAGPTIFASDPETAARKPLSVGKPVGAALVRLVDRDRNEISGEGRGELQIAGPVVTPGYWNRLEATRDAIEHGWLSTGDVAVRDGDGDIFIVDRLKDMFISGGENVYPAEVENFLYDLPDIAEAAVIGVPDPRWGEVGLAVVVPKPGMEIVPDRLRAACKSHLAGYKVPQHVRVVDSLPRTPSGKVEKHRLRDQFAGGQFAAKEPRVDRDR
ncbi:MAG: long-chain fatty acid--CoA ligase [Bradyrhizobium sp.]|nr:long-chain fatty acid--CoA ligase [Bradyrhizobium sp.]